MADLSGYLKSINLAETPIVVVSNEKCNFHSPVITAVPVMFNLKEVEALYPHYTTYGNYIDDEHLPIHVIIDNSYVNSGLSKNGIVMCELICAVDKTRIKKNIGICDKTTLNFIQNAIEIHSGLRKVNYPILYDTFISIKNFYRLNNIENDSSSKSMMFEKLKSLLKVFDRLCYSNCISAKAYLEAKGEYELLQYL